MPDGGGTQGLEVQPPAGAMTVKFTTHEAAFEAARQRARASGFAKRMISYLKSKQNLLAEHRKLFRKPQIIPKHPPESVPGEGVPNLGTNPPQPPPTGTGY